MRGLCRESWLLLLVCSLSANAIDTSQCIAPLGMQSGEIRDEDITASSSFDNGNVGPQHGRVRTESHGGAWCPKHPITKEAKEWLEINLHRVHLITATETQGRFGNGQGAEFSEAYKLEYWRPRLHKWVRYRDMRGDEVIDGNKNTYLESKKELDHPVWASKVRFLPYSPYMRTVCMRVEVYGCYWNDGIVSYSMPQGDVRRSGSSNWEFFDATYDGHWDGELRRGLGQLTDGKFGADDFKKGFYESDRSNGWVGWKNDSRNGRPVEIKFEFDAVREFSAVHIYANNQFTKDVMVFSEAKIMFSVGGQHYVGEPITYGYIEDRIFETSRNISIKLHHRVGKFVKLQLYFAARWVMISEVTFDSDIAHGNFTVEAPPPSEVPARNDVFMEKNPPSGQSPVSTAKEEDHTYMAIIIGVLTAVILLLGVSIYVIVTRHRQRKCFASPLASKSGLPNGGGGGHSSTNTAEKGGNSGTMGSYGIKDVDDNYNQPPTQRGTMASTTTMTTLPHHSADKMAATMLLIDRNSLDVKLEDYQEPYQAFKCAPYYSYSTVVMEMRDILTKCSATQSDTSYDYAVPELGTMPLLSPETTSTGANSAPVPLQPPPPPSGPIVTDRDSIFAASRSVASPPGKYAIKAEDLKGKKSPSNQEVLSALKRRLEQTEVPEFPRHRLRMVSKLAEGAFGTVYVAEADGIPEYGASVSLGQRLVAVKFLLQNANEKEKLDFHRDVRILAALEDPNIARVLGMCSTEEPLCVVMEYLDHGDLCQFLKSHVSAENSRTLPTAVKTLSFNCLLYMATQIASGMRYLETLNFVHRDLATRNCLVGKAYHIKISDFGTDNELYAADYYKVDGSMALPIRWMAWESVYQGKYTTKSDVWSFAVTLWEILNLGRRTPYDGLSDPLVVDNLAHMQLDDGQFCFLPRPPAATKDIYDLMCECWRRHELERPSFREIHLFLQRKNLGYAAPITL